MHQPPLGRRIASTVKVLGTDALGTLRKPTRRVRASLTEEQRKLLGQVRKDGFAIVTEYWERNRALEMRDRLAQYLQGGSNRDFANGAQLRLNEGASYDAGVQRLYRIDRLEPELSDFRCDRFVMDVVDAYYGMHFDSELLLYQRNMPSSTETRGYHVDTWRREFKAFLYLDDVEIENGPFAYLPGTHRRTGLRLRKQLLGNRQGPWTSFHEADIASLPVEEVPLTGSAGTLILADVRGLHRGLPQHRYTRAILVNYLYGP